MAFLSGGGTAQACISAGCSRFHRNRYRRSAPQISQTAPGNRRAAHGWNERGRRCVWRRQNVFAAGGEVRAGDEKSGGVLDAVHGSGKNGGGETAGPPSSDHGQRRRA